MDKLKFWKKKDEFADLGLDLGDDLGLGAPAPAHAAPAPAAPAPGGPATFGHTPGDERHGIYTEAYGKEGKPTAPEPDFEKPGMEGFAPRSSQPMQQRNAGIPANLSSSNPNYVVAKEIEIVSTKLETLRVTLEGINQRLANLERIARKNQDRW